MKPLKPFVLLCTAFTFGVAGTLASSIAKAEDGAATELEAVVVSGDGKGNDKSYRAGTTATATRTDTPVLLVPQSVTTVTSQALKDKSADNLDDALNNVSGITQGNTIAGANDAIMRRGFGESRDGSILTDGLNTALPHSFNATTDSVEVLKGPASTLYGVLDPGGMVNVVTKKPEDQFSAEAWSKFYAYGAGRYSTKGGFDVTGPLSDTGISYRMIMEGEKGDYWRNFGENKNFLVAPSLSWEREGTRIDLSYTHENYLAPYDRGTVYDTTAKKFLDISSRQRLDEPWSEVEGNSDLFKASLKQELSDSWDLSVNYGFSKDSFTADQTRVTAYNSATGVLTRRSDVRGYYDTTVQSLRADLTGTEDVLGFENEFLFGAALRNERISRAALQNCNVNTRFNVQNPVYNSISPCVYNAATSTNEYQRLQTTAFYAQDRLHLTDDLIAVGGLRLEHYDVVAGTGNTVNSDTDGNAWVPNAGLVWQVRPDTALYANVARTFRPNSSINSAYGSLDPEEGISYEIGSKVDINPWLSGTLAFFYAEKKNVAYSETVNGSTVYRTAGLVRSKGVELDFTGRLTDDLQLIGSYGLTDAVVVDDPSYSGNELANVARNTASMRLAYDYGDVFGGAGSLRFGGGIRAVGRRAGDAANSFYMPGYGVLDLFATYTIEREHPIEIQLNLNNILNKTYYTSSIGSSAYSVSVGQAFNAALSVSVKF